MRRIGCALLVAISQFGCTSDKTEDTAAGTPSILRAGPMSGMTSAHNGRRDHGIEADLVWESIWLKSRLTGSSIWLKTTIVKWSTIGILHWEKI